MKKDCRKEFIRDEGGIGEIHKGRVPKHEEFTENASRNVPNIGKNVPDTMCGLGGIRNIFHHIPPPDTE